MTFDPTTSQLSAEEQKFLYNLEVLGLTQQRSAELAGVKGSPSVLLKRPDIMVAHEMIRQATRAKVNITKDDVIMGIRSAIDDAKLLSDPMAQIAGWREISKMLGYDAARELKITISGDVKATRRQIAQLPDADLVQLLGADSVIDADFYVVTSNG